MSRYAILKWASVPCLNCRGDLARHIHAAKFEIVRKDQRIRGRREEFNASSPIRADGRSFDEIHVVTRFIPDGGKVAGVFCYSEETEGNRDREQCQRNERQDDDELSSVQGSQGGLGLDRFLRPIAGTVTSSPAMGYVHHQERRFRREMHQIRGTADAGWRATVQQM